MGFLVQQTAHQLQLRPVAQKKSAEGLAPLGVETDQGMQMPAVNPAW
jgi:hypothetical protein